MIIGNPWKLSIKSRRVIAGLMLFAILLPLVDSYFEFGFFGLPLRRAVGIGIAIGILSMALFGISPEELRAYRASRNSNQVDNNGA